jgi:hypothetical protein
MTFDKKPVTSNDLAIEICKDQFANSLHQAMKEAGGSLSGPVENMTYAELRDSLAQNGIRFAHSRYLTCSAVSCDNLLKKALEKLNK